MNNNFFMNKSTIKIASYFIVLYLILVSSILSFYTDTLSGYNKNLTSTINKISGIEYLKLLHRLSFDAVNSQDKYITNQSMKENINAIYALQKKHPKFNNPLLNNYLRSMQESKKNYSDYFEFFDFINHENYVVGNTAELLFSREKKKYFLGTLMTHYLPEFFISLGISRNLLNELVNNGYINNIKKSIYIEQNKLVYLSSEELHNIISLLSEHEDTKPLNIIITRIQQKLDLLKKNRNSLTLQSIKNNALNLKIIQELVVLAEELNNENTNLLEQLILNDKKYFNDSISYYHYLIIFMITLISAIFIYFFRIFNLNTKKDKELKKLNESLMQLVKQEVEKNKQQQLLMLQQSRLAQMGEMISMIAHQWRQPLNNLAIINQTIAFKYERGKLDDNLMNDFNKNSNKQIQGMSKTIDDFRNFFKPEKVKKEYCVNKVVRNTIAMLSPSFSQYELCISFEETKKIYSNGFPNELGQALINIINNAKDALIDNNIKDKKIEISLAVEAHKIIISISDNAGGIPIEIIDRIFEPYFSTKEDKNGTGLGLYMAKLIIDEHLNGKVTVSNTNSGANFNICLDSSYTE